MESCQIFTEACVLNISVELRRIARCLQELRCQLPGRVDRGRLRPGRLDVVGQDEQGHGHAARRVGAVLIVRVGVSVHER